jgi:hypothetical protein
LRTSFVSLLWETGMAIEEISHLVGHNSTVVTETVYRHKLCPVIRSGADLMDHLFPSSAPDPNSGQGAGTVRCNKRRTTAAT